MRKLSRNVSSVETASPKTIQTLNDIKLGQMTTLYMIFHVVFQIIDWLIFVTHPSSPHNFEIVYIVSKVKIHKFKIKLFPLSCM